MDVSGVVKRVVLAYWPLIVGLTLVGGLAGAGLHYGEPSIYTSDVRLVLDAPDPRAAAESTSIADTAKSIATSPGHVEAALAAAGVQRDIGKFATRNIDIQPLGTSGVMDLQVKDINRNAAAVIANALATDILSTRASAGDAQANDLVKSLSAQITALDAALASVDAKIAAYRGSADPSTNAAFLSGLYSERASIAQERLTLEQQKIQIAQSLALRPQAAIIDPAVPASEPDPSRAPIDTALGALGGLVVAVMCASVLAVLRPRISGRREIEHALNARVLGEFDPLEDDVERTLGARLRIAASRAGVKHVQLVPVNDSAESTSVVGVLAERLGYRTPAGLVPVPLHGNGQAVTRPRRKTAGHDFQVIPFDPTLYSKNGNATETGLVLVAPTVLHQADVDSSEQLVALTGWPIVGVITYSAASRRSQAFGIRNRSQALAPVRNRDEIADLYGYREALK
jgi:capsular polysaccharide biosynthesis protein